MNKKIALVIPIVGKSRRFIKSGYIKHKAFLSVANSFILKEIISQFSKEDFEAYIVANDEQYKTYKNDLENLKNTSDIDIKICVIEDHEKGPTYSVRKLNIDEDKRIVIHYCDFLVEMQIHSLKELLTTNDCVAPYFVGFHPASFGETKFAYMLLSSSGQMKKLREKESFTEDRINEPCSTGIYAFKSYRLFKQLADELLSKEEDWGHSEAYTSLCLNIAIDKNLSVICPEVQKFICLGTPKDYEEYKYWENLYHLYLRSSNNKHKTSRKHIITAAGKGSRFKNKNINTPKILIEFDTTSLIQHAKKSINSIETSIITLEEHKSELQKLKLDFCSFKYIKNTPNGQLNTLIEYLNSFKKQQDNFFVSSADYNFRINELKFDSLLKKSNPDIVILTTKWNTFAFEEQKNYGFIKCDETNRVLNIVEKSTNELSDEYLDNLLMGTFWFKDSSIIRSLEKKISGNSEVFIATTINTLLPELNVFAFNVDYWLSLGTPKEMDLANYWFDFFRKRELKKN